MFSVFYPDLTAFKHPHRPPSTNKHLPELLLNISTALRPLPQTHTHDTREGEQDAESNAQAPDGLHLVANSSVRAGPLEIIDLAHVGADGRHEGLGAAAGFGERGAVQVGQGLADGDGDNDDGDEEGGVEGRGDQEREDEVPEEDVGDGAVEDGDAGLRVVRMWV